MDRIEKLRQTALPRTVCNDEFFYLFYKRYSENRYESEFSKVLLRSLSAVQTVGTVGIGKVYPLAV